MSCIKPPRGLRNHNPGNLRLPASDTRPGYVGSDKDGYSVFTSAQHGLESLARLLVNYGRANLNTIAAIIGRYAPISENDTAAYASYLAKRLKTETDAPLDMKSANTLADLMMGIVFFENGSCPYNRTMIFNAAKKAITGVTKI